jgi:hypothetical protein
MTGRRDDGPFTIDIPFTIELTQEEILEDLCWPHPPPGRWRLEEPGGASYRPSARANNYPLPMNGIPVAMTVRNWTLASSGRPAM